MALRWTERDLARRAGVPYQRVQALERASPAGKSPYSRYLADVLRALDEGEGNPSALLPPNPRFAAAPVAGEIPVYAKRPGGMEIGMMRLPRSMAHVQGAYAVQIWGSSMTPKYHPKDVVIVNPTAPPRPFGGVLAMNEDRSDVCIGEFVSETDDEWIVARFGAAPEVRHLPRKDYPIIHAIVAVSTDLVSV